MSFSKLIKNGQTPLAIAQRLGYLSVSEELKLVTQTTLVSTTIKTTEEKYKVFKMNKNFFFAYWRFENLILRNNKTKNYSN